MRFPVEYKIIKNTYFVKDLVHGKALTHLKEVHTTPEINRKLLEPLKKLLLKNNKFNIGSNEITTPQYAHIIFANTNPWNINVLFSNTLNGNKDGVNPGNPIPMEIIHEHHHHCEGAIQCKPDHCHHHDCDKDGYDWEKDYKNRLFTADEILSISANDGKGNDWNNHGERGGRYDMYGDCIYDDDEEYDWGLDPENRLFTVDEILSISANPGEGAVISEELPNPVMQRQRYFPPHKPKCNCGDNHHHHHDHGCSGNGTTVVHIHNKIEMPPNSNTSSSNGGSGSSCNSSCPPMNYIDCIAIHERKNKHNICKL
jgi:hypothetical protein